MIKYDWKTIICSTCGTHYECTDGLETVADGCHATVTQKGYLVPAILASMIYMSWFGMRDQCT